MTNKPVRILIVDDDEAVRGSFALYLEDYGYRILEAGDGETGLNLFKQFSPDLVLTDLRMPKKNGLDLLAEMVSLAPEVPVLVVSGVGVIQDVVQSLRTGAWNYITKPVVDMAVLRYAVEQALEKARLVTENMKYHQYLEEEVVRRTQQLAQSTRRANRLAIMAESANRAKSEFLANMSHELRTPLNSIKVLSRVLAENREGRLDEKQIEMLEQIGTSGNELLELVNEVLDVSRLEQTALTVEKKEFSLARFALRIERMLSPLAWAKGLDFEVVTDADAPLTIYTDPLKLFRVVRNIVGNAVKFTERGRVDVRLFVPPADTKVASKGASKLAISIKDTGIGIPDEKHQKIFRRFEQVDGATTRNFSGAGLGLALVSQYVEALEGEVLLESVPGVGSLFTVVVPVAPPEGVTPVGTVSQYPGRVAGFSQPLVGQGVTMFNRESVLIIDDDMREVFNLSALLEQLGLNVSLCTSRKAVLERLEKLGKMDVVVATSGLLSLVSWQQAVAELEQAPPLILVTDHVASLKPADGVTFLPKPLVFDDLLPLLQENFI